MRKIFTLSIIILNIFWISTKASKANTIKNKDEALTELYSTLEQAYIDIKEIEQKVKAVKLQYLIDKKEYTKQILALRQKINTLLEDKKVWINEYQNLSNKTKKDVFSLYAKISGSHKLLTPALEIQITPIDNLVISAECGVQYTYLNSNTNLIYNIGINYKFFGI